MSRDRINSAHERRILARRVWRRCQEHGLSLDDLAAVMGCSKQRVHQLVRSKPQNLERNRRLGYGDGEYA